MKDEEKNSLSPLNEKKEENNRPIRVKRQDDDVDNNQNDQVSYAEKTLSLLRKIQGNADYSRCLFYELDNSYFGKSPYIKYLFDFASLLNTISCREISKLTDAFVFFKDPNLDVLEYYENLFGFNEIYDKEYSFEERLRAVELYYRLYNEKYLLLQDFNDILSSYGIRFRYTQAGNARLSFRIYSKDKANIRIGSGHTIVYLEIDQENPMANFVHVMLQRFVPPHVDVKYTYIRQK